MLLRDDINGLRVAQLFNWLFPCGLAHDLLQFCLCLALRTSWTTLSIDGSLFLSTTLIRRLISLLFLIDEFWHSDCFFLLNLDFEICLGDRYLLDCGTIVILGRCMRLMIHF